MAACVSYLGQDRVDVQLAAKEVSRFMSKPEAQDWSSAKHLARYLKDNRSVVIVYKHQKLSEKTTVWSDADFAGCGGTRRSTSGGVVVFGEHCVKTYSQTRETVGLFSGESEFYGIVKAGTMGLGMKGLMADLGLEMKVHVNAGSSAARRIASSSGSRRSEAR